MSHKQTGESRAPARVTPRGFQECQGTQQLLPTAPSPRCAWQWGLTTLNTGLSKPLSPAGAGDTGSSSLCQGWGRRRAGNLGESWASPPTPLPALQLPQIKPCVFRRWMGQYTGAKRQALTGMGYLYPLPGKSCCIQQKSLSLEIWDLHSGGRSLQRQTTPAQASLWSNHSFPVA